MGVKVNRALTIACIMDLLLLLTFVMLTPGHVMREPQTWQGRTYDFVTLPLTLMLFFAALGVLIFSRKGKRKSALSNLAFAFVNNCILYSAILSGMC